MNKDQIYMNIAKEYAKFSKCISLSVGCIIVSDSGKIIASGVNGSIPNTENCCDHHFNSRDEHHKWSLDHEIHAEMNTIIELASGAKITGDISFYVTHSPCQNCLKHILGLQRNGINISKIVYGEVYHRASKEEIEYNKSRCSELGIDYYEICESFTNNP